MDIRDVNRLLYEGKTDAAGLLPHLEALKELRYVFEPDFGLKELPEQPGLLLIRGPRQYGKSTWLEAQIKKTVTAFGGGSAFYLNGDEVKDSEELLTQMDRLIPLYANNVRVKRLFIDEITAVEGWEIVFKRLFDQGKLKDILIVSTGSKATDLRRGSERLPGRKGKLARNNYLFTPISFREFQSRCGSVFESKTLTAYLLSGGCPIACNEIAVHGKISEYLTVMIRDWMYGECLATGRNRSSLLGVLEILIKTAGIPLGQTRLAREAGLANNTVAAGYVELLGDLLTVAPCYAWDASRKIAVRRKPAKFHFINVLAALAWHPARIASLDDFENLKAEEKAKFYEWLVAQELWRRAAIRGEEIPEELFFWKSDKHELDFAAAPRHFIEVKTGASNPLEFSWFPKIFPHGILEVINPQVFESGPIRGLRMEDFLRQS